MTALHFLAPDHRGFGSTQEEKDLTKIHPDYGCFDWDLLHRQYFSRVQ